MHIRDLTVAELIDDVLPSGKVVVHSLEAASLVASLWEGLAYQGGNPRVGFPVELTIESIVKFGEKVRSRALELESNMAPRSSVTASESRASLCWEGTFTRGRWLQVDVDLRQGTVTLSWETGTGKRSTFFGSQGLEDVLLTLDPEIESR